MQLACNDDVVSEPVHNVSCTHTCLTQPPAPISLLLQCKHMEPGAVPLGLVYTILMDLCIAAHMYFNDVLSCEDAVCMAGH